MRSVLWWGRFDPEYSRNRIMRKAYAALGWRIENFRPTLSSLGDIEALLRPPPRVDLVHVPCFRQRDLPAAVRYARRHGIRILFDPLISSYDKQVFERQKFSPDSPAARRLLTKERKLFQSADLLIADTPVHADFFAETLGAGRERLSVVYVGAEEPLFSPGEASQASDTQPLEVLFYGSFIPLHGAEVIAEAAQLYEGPPVHWWFIGNGPARKRCEASLHAMDNVTFEDWVDYRELPARIRHADVVLGIFGTTKKAGRVIPNKVYQALACGRPVITRVSSAYPREMTGDTSSGVIWVEAGSAADISEKLADLARHRENLPNLSTRARNTYLRFASFDVIVQQLATALTGI